MRRLRRLGVRLLGMLLLVAVGVAIALWWARPQLTEEEVRRVIVTTVQDESPAAFFVTGTLDITATSTVSNTRVLFPELLRLDLGTTKAVVRLPGRVSYGFDVSHLRPDDIRLQDDGVVEVQVPPLEVHAVEPDLSAMEVETSVGWARLHARSGQDVEQRAMTYAQQALRKQGEQHLEANAQPRINTARALHQLLVPVLETAGWSDPHFRFHLSPDLILEPEGTPGEPEG